ncbi:hypothetical protein Q3G72_001373 [Acer saccharum]|nr:hypothetical protein Q3G72_001373 [Acer saccharum]
MIWDHLTGELIFKGRTWDLYFIKDGMEPREENDFTRSTLQERRARPKAWALDLWGSGNRPDKLKQRSGGVSVREIIRSKVSANKGRRSECESERRAGVGSRKYRKAKASKEASLLAILAVGGKVQTTSKHQKARRT